MRVVLHLLRIPLFWQLLSVIHFSSIRGIPRSLLPGLVAGLVSCGSDDVDEPGAGKSAPQVEVASAGLATFDTTRQWPGTMEPLRIYEIMAPENGRVVEFHIDVGSAIRAGDLIAKMRFPDADARKDALGERLALLMVESERLRALAGNRSVSDAAVAAAEIELLAARAELRGIEAVLGEGDLKAPADGWVLETHTVAGSSIVEEAVLARVADAASMGVRLNIPNTEIHYLDDPADLTATAGAETTHAIDRIIRRGSAGANATTVELWLDPETARTTGAVTIRYHASREAITIPWSAVATDDNRTWVAVVDGENRIRRRDITPGATSGTSVEVVEGLQAGERIVLYQPRSHGDESLVVPVARGESDRTNE